MRRLKRSVIFECRGADPEFQEKPLSTEMDTAARMLENASTEYVDKIIDLGEDGTPGKREYF
jgi:hypothetical protein